MSLQNFKANQFLKKAKFVFLASKRLNLATLVQNRGLVLCGWYAGLGIWGFRFCSAIENVLSGQYHYKNVLLLGPSLFNNPQSN